MMNDERPEPRFGAYSSFFIGLVACCLAWFLPTGLSAQVIRLPAVEPASDGPPGQLVSHPDSSAQILQAPGETGVAAASPPPGQPQIPPGVRDGVFQKVLFEAAYLAPGPSPARGLGMDDVQLQGIFAVPCPTRESPLVITPGFAVHYLQGPQNVDLPPQLHEGYAEFRWLSQVTPQWGLDLSLTPGFFSDFNQDSSKAFRLAGHAAAAWTCNENTKIVLGAAYLDRFDVEVIPIGGVVWTPYEDAKFDLIFPHPKISHRIRWYSPPGDQVQDWVYVAGESAGDMWAIRRTDGRDDLVVLSDYRLILGTERKVAGGMSARLEIGYVFGRRIRYSSDTPEFRPADTVMVRGGLTY
jgi:hypothetical protein